MSTHGPTGFHGRSDTLVERDGLAARRTRFEGGQRIEPHAHDSTYLCLVLRGHFSESIAGAGAIVAGPGTTYVVPAGRPHVNVFGARGADCFRVEISRALSVSLGTEVPIPSRPVSVAGGPAAWRALRLFRRAARSGGSPDLEECLVDTMLGMEPEGRLLRSPAPRWLRAVRERLADTLSESPSLTDLAVDAGVHPIYLARAFRRHYGCSIGECLQSMRVVQAGALLALTRRPLVEIASAVGYADQSHFTRMFKARTGTTPAAFRQRRARATG